MYNDPRPDPLDLAFDRLGGIERVTSHQSSALSTITGTSTRIVIAGCGYLGRLAREGARAAGLEVAAFADNNASLWNTSIDGVRVLSPSEAVARYNGRTTFVVAIYNGTPLRRQLRALGCTCVVPYPMFVWAFSQFMPAEDRFERPSWILEHSDDIRRAYHRLADERSRAEFAAQIAWRCSLDYRVLPEPDPAADMYFAPDVFRLSEDEVLVDCGAFDGDSIRMFLDRTAGAFRAIYALEPDPANLSRLRSYVATLPERLRDRVTILPYGASDHAGRTAFTASGTSGARMMADGQSTIECRRLDDLVTALAPTIIKMDIEGAEPLAIQGAVETIRKALPILAVCAYHRCEHLWTLPELIAEALPAYQIHLRRYAEECWETVYYAVPPSRVVSTEPEAGIRPS